MSGTGAPTTRPVLVWAAGAALWLPLLLRWQHTWRSEEAYYYGWSVPALVAYLVWLRLADAPACVVVSAAGRCLAFSAVALGGALAVATLPLLETSPLWPMPAWAGAIGAILCSLALLALAGGWRWAGHFAFPLGFVCSALRWPGVLERPIMSALMETNATIAAEAVSWLGQPAFVHGRLIEVSSGLVGIDEACSGIRSLQSVVMTALFFGELLRFRAGRRCGLLALAVGAALLGNIARTGFLTWHAAVDGPGAVETLHDPAGVAVLVFSLGAVAFLAWWLEPRPATPVRPATPTNARLLWPRPALVAVIVAAVGAEAGTRIWFEWHERIGRPPGVSWRLELPAQGWEEVPIPPRTTQMLGYSEARQFHWRKPADGARGVAFVARWNHDPSAVAVSEGHDPTICLPAAGLRLDAELGRRVVAVEGREISFQALRFRNRAGPVWIWFCVWDGQRAAPLAAEDRAQPDLLRQRLHRLRHGLRRLEIAHVTFTAQGMADDESAEVHLRTAIAETLRRVQ